jgi:transposase-like protein
VTLVLQEESIEVEAAEAVGACRYPAQRHSGDRTQRTPASLLTTQAGDVGLRIPKLHKSSFLTSILEPRQWIEEVLFAVVMEAYLQGVSTRSVDDLVAAVWEVMDSHAPVPERRPRRASPVLRTTV